MRAKRSLGQNFIHDKNFLNKLNESIISGPKTNIIEIGPGKGALTNYLIKKKYKNIFLIEKDSSLISFLKKYESKKISIINTDALQFNLLDLKVSNNSIIVGNLPYNISSQLLIKWTKLKVWPPFFEKMYLMFQKELGERIIAKPNSKSYGRISVMSQSRFKIKKLCTAPSNIFIPKPKVDGIFLEFTPITKYENLKINNLETILKKAFLQRRKKIRTSLKDYKNILELNNFDLDLRAENLTTEDYCMLSNLI